MKITKEKLFITIPFVVIVFLIVLVIFEPKISQKIKESKFREVVSIETIKFDSLEYKCRSESFYIKFNEKPVSKKWYGEFIVLNQEQDTIYNIRFPNVTEENMGFIPVKKGWNEIKVKKEELDILSRKENLIFFRFFPFFYRKEALGDFFIYSRNFYKEKNASNYFHLNKKIKSKKICLIDENKFDELDSLDQEFILDSIFNIIYKNGKNL